MTFVKADTELQPLSSIDKVFDQLAKGEVPSRVVLDFSPRSDRYIPSELQDLP